MVDKIVLIDSSGLDVPDVLEWELLKMPVLGGVFMRFLTPGMVRRRLRRSFHNASLVDETMAMEVHLPLTIPANQKAQCMLSRNLSWKAVEEGLPVLSRPAMLIWGAQDRYLDVSLTGRFAGKVRDLKVEILQGCGHSPHEEMPGRVTDLIHDFLGKNMPSGISGMG
jgi:pimeloyl-ACP methyl ester carboxylesterase